MNPFSFLGPVFSAVASVFNWVTGRQNLNNTPEMQEAEKRKKDAEDDDEINRIIEKRDSDEAKKRTGV